MDSERAELTRETAARSSGRSARSAFSVSARSRIISSSDCSSTVRASDCSSRATYLGEGEGEGEHEGLQLLEMV